MRLLDEAGVGVASITLAQPSLDDVFLRATGHHLQVDEGPSVEAGSD